MKLTSLGIAGVAAAVLTGAIGHAVNSNASPIVTGCVIRFDATGPRIHENSTHLCTGANSVSVEPDGDLLITSDPHGPIISITVEEDETLSLQGITAGPSGGTGRTVVRFYSTKTGTALRADSAVLQGTYSNLWITWVHAG